LADLAEAGDEGVTVTPRPLCGGFDGVVVGDDQLPGDELVDADADAGGGWRLGRR